MTKPADGRTYDEFAYGIAIIRLVALLDEAERSRVALFFDKAGACFGKRIELRGPVR